MAQLKAKQVKQVLSTFVAVNGFTATGTEDVVTSEITTALNTAGRANTSVPLQVSSGTEVSGVLTTGNNRALVFDATTKEKLVDGSDNEVFARLTEAAGVYTLSYFSLIGGTETSYDIGTTDIDFQFVYRYEFKDLPADALILVSQRNVSDDPQIGANGLLVRELRTPTGLNTLPNLSATPKTGSVITIDVNGQTLSNLAGSGFSNTGAALTWDDTTAGYILETTDRVEVQYYV